ncbi:ankyrin repeat domain-containing protein [Streptomyces sp. NPDC093225]|uniref:ankyrin repeat domain-containing protein n=1 Tax=Streptomyces sp. NPDC093225 TaxID=3366034 RepID=UPI0037F2F681
MSARTRPPEVVRLPGGYLADDGASWRRARRYAVPRWMIERATGLRLAGDWRAACAVAAVDVTFAPSDLADRYGPAVAEAVEDDLRHLAPDLVRWHLPRTLGGRSTLLPGVRVLFARYGSGATAPVLSATTGAMVDGPQRLRLHCAPVPAREDEDLYTFTDGFRVENWIAARPLWDGRRTAELRDRLTGGAGRLPFFAPDGTQLSGPDLPDADPGTDDPAARAEWVALLHAREDVAEAYAAAGLERDLTVPESPRRYRQAPGPEAVTASTLVDLTRLEAEVRLLQAAGEGDRFRVVVRGTGNIVAEPTGSRGLRVSTLHWQEARQLPRLPEFAWSRPVDLDLVRSGRIAPQELHPLVAAALFPAAGPAVGPPGPTLPAPVRVRCRGEWHEVCSRGGELDLLQHGAAEQQRERAMRAFGGAVSGCFAVQHHWTSGEGRLPRALKEERRELFLRAQHGDTPGVTALLDAGTDPRVRDRRGYTLLHVLNLLEHDELLPRLLAAGLDPDVTTGPGGLTPLQVAVRFGGSVALVNALLAAGSRIDVIDEADLSLAQLVRRYRRTDLSFLRTRVEEEFPGIGADWYDEWMDEREDDEGYEEDDE